MIDLEPVQHICQKLEQRPVYISNLIRDHVQYISASLKRFSVNLATLITNTNIFGQMSLKLQAIIVLF